MESEIARILAMSDDEVLAEVRAEGRDPDQVATEGLAIFERAVEQVDGWRFSLNAFRALLLDIEASDMTIRELRRLLLVNRKTGNGLIGNPVELARYINGLISTK